MIYQAGICFKFLWPFQNLETLLNILNAQAVTNWADIGLGHHKFFFTAHISNLGMWQHNNDDFWQVMPIFLVRVPIFVFLT